MLLNFEIGTLQKNLERWSELMERRLGSSRVVSEELLLDNFGTTPEKLDCYLLL